MGAPTGLPPGLDGLLAAWLPGQPGFQQAAELLGRGHHCPSSAGAGSRNQ